jgi:hypothetical protein
MSLGNKQQQQQQNASKQQRKGAVREHKDVS